MWYSFGVIDVSVFTPNTPSSVLAAPPTVAPAFLATSLAFSVIFFIMFTGISFRHIMGKAGNVWEKPMVQRASAWIGISSFLVGMWSSIGRWCSYWKFLRLRLGIFPHYSHVLREGGQWFQPEHPRPGRKRSTTHREYKQCFHEWAVIDFFYQIKMLIDVVPVVWVGYAFFAVPVVVSLAKLHVLATKWIDSLQTWHQHFEHSDYFKFTVCSSTLVRMYLSYHIRGKEMNNASIAASIVCICTFRRVRFFSAGLWPCEFQSFFNCSATRAFVMSVV